METIIYFIITVAWWISSFSILLPLLILLMLSETFRDKWFSLFYSKVMIPLFGPKFLAIRKQLFQLLEEHLSKRNKSVPLKVLEIGIGTGANLQYYPENSDLIALDINPGFIQIFNKNRKNYPQVKLNGIVISYAEDMKEISSGSFDVVVCTHVLCSAKSVDSVLKEVQRVLKQGGKFLFMEHVAFRKTQVNYLVQLLAAPLWRIYFVGCRLNRNTDVSIKKAGFNDVYCEETHSISCPLFIRPHIFGIATK